jgi:hypothetical protein
VISSTCRMAHNVLSVELPELSGPADFKTRSALWAQVSRLPRSKSAAINSGSGASAKAPIADNCFFTMTANYQA